MSKGGWTNFGLRSARIQRGIKPIGLGNKMNKTTQSESNFEGVFLEDKKIKMLWVLSFFGPVGLIVSLLLSTKKNRFEKNRIEFFYCDFTRARIERITVFSLIMTIVFSLVFYYKVLDKIAIEEDIKYKQEQRSN
jgi:uncharacterized BrkB/YihY/UPF0761 family membrane protein